MQVEQAAKILNEIMKRDNKVMDSEWKSFVISSRGLYVKVMRKLRDVGLVEKNLGVFRLSSGFSDSLTKLSEKWSELMDAYSEGDREIEF
jgi:hypothetical protein